MPMNRESQPSDPHEETSAVRRSPLDSEDDAHELQEHEFTLEPEDDGAGPFDEHTAPWGTLPLPPLPPWATTARALLEPPTLPGQAAGVFYDEHPTPAAEPGISTREAANAYAPEFIAAYNQRFARAPRNPHDAHRPLEVHIDLERVFTWQEERRLTGSLTLHYKRVMYVVDPDCEAAKMARGKRVLVRENQAGEIVIEHRGVRLPAQAFPKDSARIRQGAIVENKLLGPTLELIQTVQRERDKATLQTRRITLREEDMLRKSMGDHGLPHRRPKRAAQQQHPLAAVLEWARAQTEP